MNNKLMLEDMPDLMAQVLEEMRNINVRMGNLEDRKAREILRDGKPEKIIFTDDVCRLLHRTKATVYRMVARGEIPCYKSGKNLNFIESEIVDWVKAGKRMTVEELMQMNTERTQHAKKAARTR